MRRRTRTPVHYEIEYSTWKQWEIQQIELLLIELQQISYCQSRSRVHEKWWQCFQETWARSSNHSIYKCLLETFKTKAGWVKNLLKSFSFEAKAGSIKINSRDWLQGLMQKQVEIQKYFIFQNYFIFCSKTGWVQNCFCKRIVWYVCMQRSWLGS